MSFPSDFSLQSSEFSGQHGLEDTKRSISKRSVQTSNALVQGGCSSESPLAAARQGERAARDEDDESG